MACSQTQTTGGAQIIKTQVNMNSNNKKNSSKSTIMKTQVNSKSDTQVTIQARDEKA